MTDDLDTITPVNNSILYLKADTGDTITITDSGNITNTPVVLSGQYNHLVTPVSK